MSSIKPIKTLPITGITLTPISAWPYDEGAYYGEDQWWAGGPAPQPVTFTLEGTIIQQDHSSFSTPQLYVYNGLDIRIGDWYVEALTGKALRITNIDVGITNTGYLKCTIEDVDRYEQFSAQDGVAATGSFGFIVSLDDLGIPMFHTLTVYQSLVQTNPGFIEDVISRFKSRNLLGNRVRINQPGHTFQVGDSIILNSDSTFSLANASTIAAERLIGKVTQIGIPGVNWFNYEPRGQLQVGLEPVLPGDIGNIVWLDPANPGKLTASKPNNIAIPVYIKVDETTGVKLFDGPIAPLNRYDANSAPTINDDAADGYGYGSQWVNISTGDVYILVDPTIGAADWKMISQGGPIGPTGPTGAIGPTGDTGPVGPPAVGAYVKHEFVATQGQTTFTAAYVPGYVDVYYNGVRLTPSDFVATDANTVNLVNPATAGDPVEIIAWQISSISDLTGPTGSTGSIGPTGPAATGAYVRHEFVAYSGQTIFYLPYNVGFLDVYYNGTLLTEDQYVATDGNMVTLVNPSLSGDPLVFISWEIATVSQLTGPTGPTGMQVSFFFNDIAARNAATPQLGQVCYVLDDGTGSNCMYVAAQISPSVIWIPISIAPNGNNIGPQTAGDRRFVDGYRLQIAYDTTSPAYIGTLNPGSIISKVSVKVTTEFDDVGTITIGTMASPGEFMTSEMCDPSLQATFINEEGYLIGASTNVYAFINPGASTQGDAIINVTFQ